MLIGTCQVELFIPESGSLKSKRFILKSLKTRLRNKFNVSVAEVGENDKWQRAVIGLAMVSNDRKFIDTVFSQIINLIEAEDRVELIDHYLDVY